MRLMNQPSFNTRQQGQAFEALAESYLCQRQLIPIMRNFQCRSGEIDLIMKDGSCIVFIEVKYRTKSRYGSAVDAVTYHKQRKLKRTALFWLQKNGLSTEHTEFRFDIVAIQGSAHTIEWFTNTLVEG
ncbi:YraN family protein [Photobacterium damselae]|nr:YraN family protein [Photobacterium damselae]